MPIQKKLAILDPEEIGPGFCNYLLSHPEGFQPVYCNSMEELEAIKADIAIIGKDFWDNHPEDLSKNKNWLFLDEKGAAGGERHIMPYQPADTLLMEIRQQLIQSGISIPSPVSTGPTQLEAVISAHGYDLQTGFALVYSLIQAQNRRVLYLNLQYYSGFFDTYPRDMGDLFYALRRQEQLQEADISMLITSIGRLDLIPPVRMQMDLEDITAEELGNLMSKLQQMGCYDLIVFDLPVRASFYREAYLRCRRTYSLQKEGPVYDLAQMRLMTDLGMDEIAGRDGESTCGFQIVKMPQIAGTFGVDETIYEELMFGEMAGFIRKRILQEE